MQLKLPANYLSKGFGGQILTWLGLKAKPSQNLPSESFRKEVCR